jgi:sugar diacid utilization regulator
LARTEDAEPVGAAEPVPIEHLADAHTWLADVAAAAAQDAGASSELLGGYLSLLVAAATTGHRPEQAAVAGIAELGARAARHGVAPGSAVNLYLSAAWRLWRELPRAGGADGDDAAAVRRAAEAVLQVSGDAVAVHVEGFQEERRQSIRREESVRRAFIDDLLRGDADVAGMVERAEPFGLDLTLSHQVALATAPGSRVDAEMIAPALESAVVRNFGDRDVLVATKENMLVVLVPEVDPGGRTLPELGPFVHRTLAARLAKIAWRVGVGRAHRGFYGIARSYEEAREALDLGQRLALEQQVVNSRAVLLYRVLGRDQAAMDDLVQAVLTPLERARGGAEPLLATIEAYVGAGRVATEAARRMHLSVRALTYRLERIRELTGLDPTNPEDAFVLQTATVGARLLGWPGRPSAPSS